MKKMTAVVGIAALAALIAVPVLAQGPGYDRGRGMMGYRGGDPGASPRFGWAHAGLTEEQRSRLAELRQKHFDETADIRSQMWAKQAELKVLMSTSDPDLEKARALQKEVSELKGRMAQERIGLYAEIKKIDPEAGFGRGWARGKGFGPGTARGWHRGGPGMGPCWN